MTFPNIQTDTTNKLTVYIGLSLMVIAGYLENKTSNKIDVLNSEFRTLSENVSMDSLNQRLTINNLEKTYDELDFLSTINDINDQKIIKRISTYLDTIRHKMPKASMLLYLFKTKDKKNLVETLLIEKENRVDSLTEDLTKYEKNGIKEDAHSEFLKRQLSSIKKDSKTSIGVFILGTLIFLAGVLSWMHIDEKRNNKLVNLQIQIQELNLKKLQKETQD